mmetsp:Transcript_57034/g.118322  ORF Transcript_57034/g.118322 Transcript_57034/m.118322 type:complete len:148 (-) Transcript_57034:102-545(-)
MYGPALQLRTKRSDLHLATEINSQKVRVDARSCELRSEGLTLSMVAAAKQHPVEGILFGHSPCEGRAEARGGSSDKEETGGVLGLEGNQDRSPGCLFCPITTAYAPSSLSRPRSSSNQCKRCPWERNGTCSTSVMSRPTSCRQVLTW